MLDGLRSSLITPDLVAEFIAEYTAEWNRLQGKRRSEAARRDRKLADVNRKIGGIIDAIERGIITSTTKERLEALETEKTALEHTPVVPALPSIHPHAAERYRAKVADIHAALTNGDEAAAEAVRLVRELIDGIVVTPAENGGQMHIDLTGNLAPMLLDAQTGARRRWLRGLDLTES